MTFLQRWQGLADNKICAFAWFVIRRFSEERVPQAAASMTFTTLLALVPVLTVMVAVASIFPVFDRWSDSFVSFVNQTIVPQGADMVFDYIDAFRDQANRLTAIGSVMLVVTSLMLIRTIDNAFNRIWRVNTQRPWMMQFLVYWALLTFGPLSLGVGISFMVGSVQDSVLSSGAQQWADALKTAARLAFMTLLLWGLYRFVPNRFVPARQAFVGALITAFCLETARFLFTWYMGNFDGYRSIYGAFAAMPFFLLWLNLLWTLVLGGAVLTSSLSYWQGEAFRRGFDSRGRFDDVLKILLLLDAAQKEGRTLSVQEFRRHINMGYDELGELLEKLARYGYIYSGRQGWVLKTGADSIELSELFKLFVYRPLPVERDHVNQAVDAVMTPCLQTLNMTLAEFDAQAKKQQQS
ncbi:TPA: YihY family inner membrane protein [Neisseria gonorrhoeae]|uniref:YihY family inner membrane protein n=1 Tax=Neisseria gonorrhoeae TaxID=485 RepID=UPI001F4E9E50|nr:YihY family inner membrane protein [Neisseria gonorrhoeae]MCH8713426.1 YihY family inner membrane protein [Neisseria gonorrhoeae]MCH8716002.1 YihY family inner membrane protein [Neisseria gonorrhoeae]MCH8717674.1 YihY family inner membrane protein [Neisseria gonorrhoeae]MCH8725655.1 YihY family inner membrane protein [Neisseria gonorrhoeae]MCH8739422.1 YihY family inner membrane protein [Neisseria gonorrhoeae]